MMPPLPGRTLLRLLSLALAAEFFLPTRADRVQADETPPASPGGASKDEENAGSPVERLLARLREQNAGNERFSDPWCRTLKEIADLGPAAVPTLVRELDATDNDMMLRCLGFTLRAIGDKRAVPALIRALPRTLIPPGSDMGLQATDPELVTFAQKHDLEEGATGNQYGLGRPVREIGGALRTLTGEDHGEEDLYSVMLEGSKSQRQLKRRLYRQVADEWADWWSQTGAGQITDKAYATVGLPPAEEAGDIPPPPLDGHFQSGDGDGNWILESVRNPKGTLVFYDFDIGRIGKLPKRWREAAAAGEKEGGDIAAHEKEIALWATLQGFDLMGTEYQTPEGKSVYALRSLGMQTWELPRDRWKVDEQDVTLQSLVKLGRSAGPYLLHRPADSDQFAPQEHVPFLFITRHGTPGLLYVGVEVLDDSQKPGGVVMDEEELNPIHFYKGRRFAFTILEPLGE